MEKMCEQASYFYFRNPIPSSKEEVSVTFCGRIGSEICQAKRNSSSLCFPSHFPQWLFGLQLLRAVTYNSASVWTVGTSQWLYVSAEFLSSFPSSLLGTTLIGLIKGPLGLNWMWVIPTNKEVETQRDCDYSHQEIQS